MTIEFKKIMLDEALAIVKALIKDGNTVTNEKTVKRTVITAEKREAPNA